MFSGIAHQKFELLNELNDSDYSISDSSDKSDSDSSTHSNDKPLQPKENNTITLRRSTRKKEVPFVSIYYIVVCYSCFICCFCI